MIFSACIPLLVHLKLSIVVPDQYPLFCVYMMFSALNKIAPLMGHVTRVVAHANHPGLAKCVID